MSSSNANKNASNNMLQGWPVKVYRKTQQNGWESVQHKEPILATPCRGGVELRQFRVRIRIYSSTSGGDSKTQCIKRRNMLLTSTRHNKGVILFQFKTLEACNAFFDELVSLNQEYLQKNDDNKKKKDTEGVTTDEEDKRRRQEETMNYVARLLYDDDFSNFCNQLETCLKATPDGAKMLESLQTSGGST